MKNFNPYSTMFSSLCFPPNDSKLWQCLINDVILPAAAAFDKTPGTLFSNQSVRFICS